MPMPATPRTGSVNDQLPSGERDDLPLAGGEPALDDTGRIHDGIGPSGSVRGAHLGISPSLAVSWRPDGTPLSVAEGRITGIHIVVDPAKLASIHLPAPA
ncbi:hypothetical protein ACWENQ_43855 [Nonomuraea sp. NPDC004354]